jgi:hypothetical protein
MNVDIFFNILLHCDIDTIKSFSCVQPISNYFWIKKFEHDKLRLFDHMNKTIEWIHEYKKIKSLYIDDKIDKLLSLVPTTTRWVGIYLYITWPNKLLTILPKEIHIKSKSRYEQKVSFTLQNNVITLYYKIFRPNKEKSITITMNEMNDLLWKIYYHHDILDIEEHIV